MKRKHEVEGAMAAARCLLMGLRKKRFWFLALMQALDCPQLRLAEFKSKFLQLKGEDDDDDDDGSFLCSVILHKK